MNQIARFYVGTYSRPLIFGTGEVFEGKGKGIHTYLFDIEKGTLMEEGAPTETANPSFVSLSADKELLYAVNELTTFEGKKGGALNIYRREKNGELTLLSQKATGGEDPCHVVTDRERKNGTGIQLFRWKFGSLAPGQRRSAGGRSSGDSAYGKRQKSCSPGRPSCSFDHPHAG